MPMADQLVLTDTLTPTQVKEGMLETMEYRYEDRKEFQYAQIGKQLGEYNIKRYQLSKIPTIALSGVYAKNAQRNQWNFLKGNQNWFTISNVSLNMTIPIFNGFVTRSRISQTRIELQRTLNEIEGLKRTIDSEAGSARNNFQSAIARLDAQQQNLQLAEAVYTQIKKKYELGVGSQTEINIAQNEWKAAQTNYVSALSDAMMARIDWLKAIGKL